MDKTKEVVLLTEWFSEVLTDSSDVSSKYRMVQQENYIHLPLGEG